MTSWDACAWVLRMSAELVERERPRRRGIHWPTAREMEDVWRATTDGDVGRSWPTVSESSHCQREEARESRLLCRCYINAVCIGRMNDAYPRKMWRNGGELADLLAVDLC